MKSFRAAARRLVAQETSSAPTSRFFPSSRARPLTLTQESDAWALRLASLASLGEYDALACIATGPDAAAWTHNITDHRRLRATVEAAADDARRHAEPVQLRTPIQLADGRTSTALLVAPIDAVAGASATLVAARSGRAFTASDAVRARDIADLLSLDLAGLARERMGDHARRQAMALYELARIGMADREIGERLDAMADVLAALLQYDVSQVWLLRAGGSLRLAAARPRESIALEIARPRDHVALARALDGESVTVRDQSLGFWLRRTAKEVVVARLRHGDNTLGLLVLGRWQATSDPDDERLALICGDFVADVIATDARRRAVRDGMTARGGEEVRLGG